MRKSIICSILSKDSFSVRSLEQPKCSVSSAWDVCRWSAHPLYSRPMDLRVPQSYSIALCSGPDAKYHLRIMFMSHQDQHGVFEDDQPQAHCETTDSPVLSMLSQRRRPSESTPASAWSPARSLESLAPRSPIRGREDTSRRRYTAAVQLRAVLLQSWVPAVLLPTVPHTGIVLIVSFRSVKNVFLSENKSWRQASKEH